MIDTYAQQPIVHIALSPADFGQNNYGVFGSKKFYIFNIL